MGVFLVQHICFILVSGFCRVTCSDFYTSIASMEPLIATQRELIKSLEKYIMTEPKNKAVLKSYLLRYKKEDEIATKDVIRYLGNPINSYTLIKRLTRDLSFLEQIIINNTEMFKKPDNVTYAYPNKEDYDGAVLAIIRLHNYYCINVTEWADGVLNGHFNADNQKRTTVVTPMTSNDCFVIGQTLYSSNDHSKGIPWMVNALRKYTEEDIEMYGMSRFEIVEFIAFGYFKLDNAEKIIKWTKKLIALAPYDHRVTRHAQLIESYQKRLNAKENKKQNDIESKSKEEPKSEKQLEMEHYQRMCRGEVTIPGHVAKRLTCRYLTETHPFLLLAPIKMEQLYLDPDVILFYDVMSDDEIDYFRSISTPKLERAQVRNEKSGETFVYPHRISKSMFLPWNESSTIQRIYKRTAAFTGLNMNSAEKLHVSNYGIAGHYVPHFDAINNKTKGFMNRIATVLFYMSDVSQGGATVFLRLGLTVYPVKGAALFWMNMHPSCELDFASKHGACPVLEGSKWMCTVWINQKGQELLRPCNLEFQGSDYYHTLLQPFAKKHKS